MVLLFLVEYQYYLGDVLVDCSRSNFVTFTRTSLEEEKFKVTFDKLSS